MISLQFFFKRLAARIGVVSPRQYFARASEDSVALKEAETIIGKIAWRYLDGVEELTNEYWRIRQLDIQQETVAAELREHKNELAEIESGWVADDPSLQAHLADIHGQLATERETLDQKLQGLQNLIHKAEVTRKKFNGLKLKLSVLKGENAAAGAIDSVRADLQATKSGYGELAREVENIREDVRLLEEKIKGLQSEETNLRSRINERLGEHARRISAISRRAMTASTRLASLENEKTELFIKIGRTLRAEHREDSPQYREIIRKFRPIINRARKLSVSVDFHRRLAEAR